MAKSKTVAVDSKSAQEVAELFGIRQDLGLSKELCERLLWMYEDLTALDFLVFEALFTTAVLKYTRCFGEGIRTKISGLIQSGFSPEQLEQHKFFLEYRNKYLAHSVNPYEQNFAVITIPVEGLEGWSPSRLEYSHVRHLVPGSENVRNLLALATWLDGLVAGRMSSLESEVMLTLRAMSVSELSRLPTASTAGPSRKDVTRRR